MQYFIQFCIFNRDDKYKYKNTNNYIDIELKTIHCYLDAYC